MSNPVLNDKVFEEYGSGSMTSEQGASMSISGSINKTLVLLGIMLTSAIVLAPRVLHSLASINPYIALIAPCLGAFVVSIVISFKKEWSMPLSIVYAILQGIVVGTISVIFNAIYNGIVFQAITITVTVLFLMLVLYKLRIISVNEQFKSIMKVAITAVAGFYLVNFILGFFGIHFMSGNGPIQIAINAVIAGIAAFTLLLDFNFIEEGSASGLPKYFEWYAAFGLLVTLIWLYIEILKLLARLRGRN